MLTPQEVASHAFAKATFGGYNMSMVDEFLDALTADYTTLYNDNAILKSKLKTLSDTVEEYRATDNAMRKTLLAAQQMAENMVNEAEKQKQALVQEAETQAQSRLTDLRRQFEDEEARLLRAKEATADFLGEVRRAQEKVNHALEHLDELTAGLAPEARNPGVMREEVRTFRVNIPGIVEEPAPSAPSDDEDATRRIPPEPVPAAAAPAAPSPSPEATQRFDDLQFGKDYEIK